MFSKAMDELSLSDYEKVPECLNESDEIIVSEKNIKRAARVKKIRENKFDLEKDVLGLTDLRKFKKMKDEIIMGNSMLNRMGLHPIPVRKFKRRTMEKFKNVDGINFGSTPRITFNFKS